MWWLEILWCAFCIYVAKEKHVRVPKHNAQSGGKSCLQYHDHSLLTTLRTKYSEKDIFPQSSVMTVYPLVFHYTSFKLNTVRSYQLLPAIVKPSICCCSEGCECDSSPLTCVHKVFIFYKD